MVYAYGSSFEQAIERFERLATPKNFNTEKAVVKYEVGARLTHLINLIPGQCKKRAWIKILKCPYMWKHPPNLKQFTRIDQQTYLSSVGVSLGLEISLLKKTTITVILSELPLARASLTRYCDTPTTFELQMIHGVFATITAIIG